MDDGYSGIHMLTLIVLVVLEAVLYGFGAALQELGGGLEEEARDGNRKAEKILALAERPGRLVSTNLVFTTGSSLIVGAFIFRKMIWSSQNPVYAVVEALVYIILLVSLGMALPKRLAAENPEKWAMGLFPAVSVLMTLLIPVTAAVGAVSSLLLRAAGMDPSSQEEGVTEEDIMSMVNEGHEQGVLEASEAEMITNIFELGDKRAEDVMTHRKNLVLLDGSMTLKEAVRFILEEGNHSRFPVYGDNTDDILGVVHLRDVMVWAEKKACENIPIREIPDLMMEAKFIPESRSVDSLFREMQSQKIHMAIVVDEYGQLSGIVTMEDILEEIVGNIQDEYDREEELIRPLGNGAFLISGMASLEDVSEALGIQFTEEEEEDYDTLSGLLISLLDRIPGEDERPVIPCGGYDFQVERVEHKRIASVRAVPAHKEQSDTCQPEKMVVE
ncbi:MAG TPA: hemolysin family protein [Candidatus Lachnoclostridium avicola]|nr:hemolysin family protein [Candidatus Lachnoclostridium avicola]